jgi:hypothetical protein
MSKFRHFSLLISIIAALSLAGVAQSLDDSDNESWNDLQITIPAGKRVDVLLLGTVRLGDDLADLVEGRVGGGLSVKLNKALSVSPTYQHIETRNGSGVFKTEHRYSLRGTYKFPFKRFGLIHKSTYEYRVRSSGNSWRYRPALTFEKALPKSFLRKAKVFVTEEPFYVSTTKKFSRNRFSVGVSKTFNPHLTLDVYYLRQQDGHSHPGDLNVLGTAWKVHL